MTALTSLLEELHEAEIAYKTAKSSLDGSNALIIAKQRLKEARYAFNSACNTYTMQHFFGEERLDEFY